MYQDFCFIAFVLFNMYDLQIICNFIYTKFLPTDKENMHNPRENLIKNLQTLNQKCNTVAIMLNKHLGLKKILNLLDS